MPVGGRPPGRGGRALPGVAPAQPQRQPGRPLLPGHIALGSGPRRGPPAGSWRSTRTTPRRCGPTPRPCWRSGSGANRPQANKLLAQATEGQQARSGLLAGAQATAPRPAALHQHGRRGRGRQLRGRQSPRLAQHAGGHLLVAEDARRAVAQAAQAAGGLRGPNCRLALWRLPQQQDEVWQVDAVPSQTVGGGQAGEASHWTIVIVSRASNELLCLEVCRFPPAARRRMGLPHGCHAEAAGSRALPAGKDRGPPEGLPDGVEGQAQADRRCSACFRTPWTPSTRCETTCRARSPRKGRQDRQRRAPRNSSDCRRSRAMSGRPTSAPCRTGSRAKGNPIGRGWRWWSAARTTWCWPINWRRSVRPPNGCGRPSFRPCGDRRWATRTAPA